MNLTIFLFSSWPAMIASNIVSSSISLPPASIIATRSAVEATVRLRSDFSLCSRFGLITISPSTRPTLTPLIGPSHGMSEIAIAAETPIIAVISGLQSGSTLITVATTEQSFLISFGKSGRIGLSMQRDVSIAFSDGLLSLLWKEPGILPTEYIFSS